LGQHIRYAAAEERHRDSRAEQTERLKVDRGGEEVDDDAEVGELTAIHTLVRPVST
jgi:hypothetical protein